MNMAAHMFRRFTDYMTDNDFFPNLNLEYKLSEMVTPADNNALHYNRSAINNNKE